MASTPSMITQLISKFGLTTKTEDTDVPDLELSSVVALTPTQKVKALDRIVVGKKQLESTVSIDSLIECLNPIITRMAGDRQAADQMRQLAPEIGQASAIMVGSIMSPNDLQNTGLALNVANPSKLLSEQALEQIETYVRHKFMTELDFKKRVPEWIDTSLYGVGAQPIVIIPESELDNMLHPKNSGMAQENFKKFTSATDEPLTMLGSSSVSIAQETLKSSADTDHYATIGLESFSQIIKTEKNITESSKRNINAAIEEFAKDIMNTAGGRVIVDNPNVLKKSKLIVGQADSLAKDILNRLSRTKIEKFRPAVSFGDTADQRPDADGVAPLFMTIPAESVVPLFIPGNPSDHIGYFIIIDQDGNPVTGLDMPSPEDSMGLRQQNIFSKINNVMNLKDLYKGQFQSREISKVYNNIMDDHIKRALTSANLNGVEIGNVNSIYKCMFSRYLRNATTRLLYVPKDFLVYFAYDYNDNGTGRSKLEDARFALTIRMTFMICGLMAAIRDATDKKQIEFDVPPDTPDVLSLVRRVHKIYASKEALSFTTHNPENVRDNIQQSSIQIVPKNIPGVPDINVTKQQSDSNVKQPDVSGMNDATESLIYTLGVPHSALNRTSEDEYSRSVATVNLLFSNIVRIFQDITCHFLDSTMQTYLRYDSRFYDLVSKIMTESTNIDDKTSEGVGIDPTDVNDVVGKIISGIHASLPEPNIAPDKAQNEEFGDFLEIVQRAAEVLFPDDLKDMAGTDKETFAAGISAMRHKVVHKAILDFIQKSGSTALMGMADTAREFDDLIKIQNAGAEVRKTIAVLTPETSY